jgi:hypothetical protein
MGMNTIMGCAVLAIVAAGAAGCQEMLPPREDPNSYFSTSLSHYYDVFYPNNPNASRNQVFITIAVINRFDEVIYDYLDVTGTVEITWVIPPGENQSGVNPVRTMRLNGANLQRAKGYDPATGILAFAPGDTLLLLCTWNFLTNDSSNLMGKFSQRIDYGCVVMDSPIHSTFRRVTTQQKFVVNAEVRLTKKTSTFYFRDRTFLQCFIVPYFRPMLQADGHNCVSEAGIDPCRLVE